MTSLLDQLHLLWAWGWHSIRQLILPKRGWSSSDEQCQARKSNGYVENAHFGNVKRLFVI
jgi:hypothetical protein